MEENRVEGDNQINQEKYFSKCNKGKNQGFGEHYVNEEQFKFEEVNDPKKDNCFLILSLIIVANAFVLYMCHYIYTWGLSFQKEDNLRIVIFFISVFIYLGVTFAANQFTCFVNNTKDYSHYEQIFSNMAQDSCYVDFKIRCYHKVKSGKNTREVTTHRASQQYRSLSVEDNSGMIKEIKRREGRLVFVHYLKQFSFGNKETKEHFVRSYNRFVYNNIRDSYQKFSFSLEMPKYQEHVCYNNEDLMWLKYLFIAFTLIGLGAPFLILAETMIDRYQVKIHKILTNSTD